jgi:glycine cleavage system H protein|tara:strand:+ start:754 stop:1131 length:378 start_codon:yes stop_codon:yes gene_type:complete
MKFPNDIKYTKDHEWVKISDGVAYIGITEFAQSELGDIVFVDVDTLNEELDQEEVFGTIEAVKTVSDLFMPISGKVDSFNKELEDSPELINDDPYNKGWIISVSDFDESELETLLSADDYKKLVE